MTNAHAATLDQSPFSALAAETASLASRARDVWAQYLTYRRTLAELRALSLRDLRDVGLNGADLDAVARGASYGR